MKIKNNIKTITKLLYKKNRLPDYLIFFVTNKCNLRCEHCFYHKELNKNENELSLEEIEKFAKTIKGLPILLITGGEPFLRKDLSDIIKVFYLNNIRKISISTNATQKDTFDYVKKILDECPKLNLIINISLDGFKKEHEAIRKVPNSFAMTLKTYNKIYNLKSKYKNLNIGIRMTFNSFNQKTIKEAYKFFNENLKPDTIDISLVRGSAKDQKVKDIDIEIYNSLSEEINNDCRKNKFYKYNFDRFKLTAAIGKIRRKMVYDTYKKNKYITKCYAGNISGVIYSNGDVFPCELLPDKKIGNLRDVNYNFRTLWFSEKAKEINKFIKNTKCFCTHECFLTTNILYNPNHILSILKEIILLKTKK